MLFQSQKIILNMKNLLLLSIAVMALILLQSCKCQQVSTSTERIITDTTYITTTIVERDTIVYIPADTATVTATIQELQQATQPIRKQSGRAIIDLSMKGETITATAICDSLELELKLRDTVIKELNQRLEQVTTNTVQVKKQGIAQRIGSSILTLIVIVAIVGLIIGVFKLLK